MSARQHKVVWWCGLAALAVAAWLIFGTTSGVASRADDAAGLAVAPRLATGVENGAARNVARGTRADTPKVDGREDPAVGVAGVEPYIDPDAPTARSAGDAPVHIGDFVDPEGAVLAPESGVIVHVGEWLDPEDQP